MNNELLNEVTINLVDLRVNRSLVLYFALFQICLRNTKWMMLLTTSISCFYWKSGGNFLTRSIHSSKNYIDRIDRSIPFLSFLSNLTWTIEPLFFYGKILFLSLNYTKEFCLRFRTSRIIIINVKKQVFYLRHTNLSSRNESYRSYFIYNFSLNINLINSFIKSYINVIIVYTTFKKNIHRLFFTKKYS